MPMLRFFILNWVVIVMLGVGANFVVPAVAYAEAVASEATQKVRRTPAMRENVYQRLSRARELADREDYAGAMAQVETLLARGGLNSYEMAMSHDMRAYIAFRQEHYIDASAAYKKVLEQPDIPVSLEQNTLYALVQLLVMRGEYKEALPMLQRWFVLAGDTSAEAHVLHAQIRYQTGEYAEAEKAMDKALQRGRANTDKPLNKNWLLLARAVYYANRNFSKLESVYEQLLVLYPAKEYWVQAAAVYMETGDEKRHLGLLEAAYEKGFFTHESEIVMLYQALVSQGRPYKAAIVIDKAMEAGQVPEDAKAYRRAADAWYLAKEYEKAIARMTMSAKLNADGDAWFRLAQMQLDSDQFAEAADSVERALKTGGLQDKYDAYLVQGLAFYNAGRLHEARKAFVNADGAYSAVDRRGKRNGAAPWIQFIDQEQARQQRLAQEQS